jgi:hypothetical protein
MVTGNPRERDVVRLPAGMDQWRVLSGREWHQHDSADAVVRGESVRLRYPHHERIQRTGATRSIRRGPITSPMRSA